MINSFFDNFKPKDLSDINLNNETIEIINTYLKNDKMLFLIYGPNLSGKTSLINILLKNYYNTITQHYSKESIIAMIFALALHLTNPIDCIKSKYGIWLPDKNILSLYKQLEHTPHSYDFLKTNLKYKNRQSIHKDQLLDILNNWLFYCYKTPIWRERIEDFHGYPENNAIKFTNDEELENFHKKYGYELDEQSNEIYALLYSVTLNEKNA